MSSQSVSAVTSFHGRSRVEKPLLCYSYTSVQATTIGLVYASIYLPGGHTTPWAVPIPPQSLQERFHPTVAARSGVTLDPVIYTRPPTPSPPPSADQQCIRYGEASSKPILHRWYIQPTLSSPAISMFNQTCRPDRHWDFPQQNPQASKTHDREAIRLGLPSVAKAKRPLYAGLAYEYMRASHATGLGQISGQMLGRCFHSFGCPNPVFGERRACAFDWQCPNESHTLAAAGLLGEIGLISFVTHAQGEGRLAGTDGINQPPPDTIRSSVKLPDGTFRDYNEAPRICRIGGNGLGLGLVIFFPRAGYESPISSPYAHCTLHAEISQRELGPRNRNHIASVASLNHASV